MRFCNKQNWKNGVLFFCRLSMENYKPFSVTIFFLIEYQSTVLKEELFFNDARSNLLWHFFFTKKPPYYDKF